MDRDPQITAPPPRPSAAETATPWSPETAGASWSPSTPDPRPRRRRHLLVWVIALTVLALLAAGIAFVHISAHRAFDASAERLLSAIDDAEVAASLAGEAAETGTRAVDAATSIGDAAADGLVDAAARTAFTDATSALAQEITDAEATLATPLGPYDIDKPLWTWELSEGSARIDRDTAEVSAAASAMKESAERVDAAEESLGEAGTALYASTAAAATALEAANISAEALVVLDFRDAAAAVGEQTGVGPAAASAFARYVQKATELTSSAASELAEKAGYLSDTRLAIEAFARSIAGGVVLDFDWAPTVNGLGGRAGMAGTATWNTARGGFSTITLSNSVAENWPSADARALVAHEVGHSITSKCHTLFDSENQEANEEWATAWAISMGHTAEGNGVQAYGSPSPDMIARASTCR